jgi:peptidoglycan/xylan/chitin deacetylase (PgdA/CDA1 family)
MQIPIITYHSIDENNSVISTSLSTFRMQMQHLKTQGFTTISVADSIGRFKGNCPSTERCVAIAFDDGYANVYNDVFPVLKEFGFCATVFVIAGRCGMNSDWFGNIPSLPRQRLLSWNELNEMCESGWEIAAHTVTHPYLTRLSNGEAEDEIRNSKLRIEDKTGVRVRTFAYPYGDQNRRIRSLVEEHYEGACSTKLGVANSLSDPFLLERVDSYYLSSSALFGRLLEGKLRNYLWLRQVLRSIKPKFLLTASGVKSTRQNAR